MKIATTRVVALALLLAFLQAEVQRPAASGRKSTRRLTGEGEEHGLEGEGHEEEEAGEVQFETNDEGEKTRNYKKVSEDLAVYEEEYSTCIREIPDEEYTQEKVDECVGRNFIKVVLDIKYVTLKVMAKLDTKVRKMFIRRCYQPAKTVEEFSEGCDVLERDVLDMLWNGLEFVELVEINKEKYLFEYGKIPNETFRDLFSQLEILSKEFFELLDEIDSHKEVAILRLKTLIDDRTKVLKEKEEQEEDVVSPGGPAVHHTIEITETLQEQPAAGGSAEEVRKLQQKARAAKPAAELRRVVAPAPVPKGEEPTRRLGVDEQLRRNALFKKQMVNKLSDSMQKQAKMPFKNVHTPHYSKVKG